MSATQLEDLILLVGPEIFKQYHIREPIDVAERLSITLRYLASGDSITSISYQYLIGLTTATNIISETCQAIWNNLLPIVLPGECSETEWLEIAKGFEDKWNFPHCIGAIDGKHIIIEGQPNAGSSYFNYKGSHSIVLLAICDSNYIFKFVDIGAYGRRSDGGIFKESVFGQKFENNEMKIPKPTPISNNEENFPYIIVGDEAFPLKTYLLRPYPGKQNVEYDKRVFNYRLSRARRTIENSFGILANRWRIFRKPIILKVEKTIKIVQATVCLHNWLRMADLNGNEKVPYITPESVDREDETSIIQGSWRADMQSGMTDITRLGNNFSTRQAVEIREKFLHYFNNDGAVDWQYLYV
ncbi:Protein ALP1-like isoform X1 [Camponotus japonicus]